MARKSGVVTTIDHVGEVVAAIELLASTRVMVGIPSDRAARDDGPINSAALGYIHENGAPEANIPARPFLIPGVATKKAEIIAGLKRVGELAFEGKPEAVMRQFHRIGMIGSMAVKRKITTGPFVPLAQRTIDARRRRSKGSKYRRKAVTASDTKPLIDSAQMRNAVSYVLRKAGFK